MTVDPANARGGSFTHEGTTYYFCSPGCRTKFAADPAKYLQKHSAPGTSALGTQHPPSLDRDRRAPAGKPSAERPVEYTCPMHPEVVQIGPGSCPICGMALEPRVATLHDVENPELADMSRRFWISAL